MESPAIHIRIGAAYRSFVDKAWLISVVTLVLESEKVLMPAEAGLTVTGQVKIRKLNREYRGIDKPTDVLSFALQENKGRVTKFALPPDGITRLGDVVISFPQAAAQAAMSSPSQAFLRRASGALFRSVASIPGESEETNIAALHSTITIARFISHLSCHTDPHDGQWNRRPS